MITTKVIKINQDLTGGEKEDKIFYLGTLKFTDLKKLVSLEYRNYDGRGNADGIQRFFRDKRNYTDITRLKNIKNFVSDSDLDIPYFTSPIIFGFESDNQNKIEEDKLNFSGDKLEGGIIVDGQHRFYGMYEKWEEDNTFDMELPIVFLIDYDRYQLSKVFANINFTQKPVNKSLFYDLFGSIPGDFNNLSFVHNIIHDLNFQNGSSLKGEIKMLGSGPGFISQAFLVEKIHKYFLNNDLFSDENNKLLEKYSNDSENIKYNNVKSKKEKEEEFKSLSINFKKEELYINYYNLLNFYFKFINDNFGKQTKTKTTIGYGAFARLLKDLLESNSDFINNYEKILKGISSEIIKLINIEIGNISGSSESSQTDLYKKIYFIIFKEKEKKVKELVKKELFGNFNIGEEIRFIDIYTKVLEGLKGIYPNSKNLPQKLKNILKEFIEMGILESNKDNAYKLLVKNY